MRLATGAGMRERSDPTLRSPFVAGVLRAARLDADTRQRGGLDARRERRSLEDERLGGAWARRPGGPVPEAPPPQALRRALVELGFGTATGHRAQAAH